MIGFSVQPISRRVSPEIVQKYRSLPVANVSDCMSRMTGGGPRLRPYHAEGGLSGPAFTVKTRPGDNLMVHKALDIASPGDVVVVDAGGDLTNSIVGEIMITYAMKRGLAGLVINGSIRDSDAVRRMNFPVYAAGVTHRGPMKSGPGEIGRAIAFDGMVIEPGDLIIGDGDGVLCIAFDEAEEVYQAAAAKHDAENKILADLQSGGSMDRAWVDAALEQLGCKVS
ncbi:RraA family protein [Bradyrhizobium sp.]|jgi:regulator of RNase E activity RraA|uniref:RraA family protein n=1 Tax=Bradyrhizobium sp. TaxID=376 RepID=UPI002DFE6B38|nr:RraA family protein [Bradyrhizobium sp.]